LSPGEQRRYLIGGWSPVDIFAAPDASRLQRLGLRVIAAGINWRTRTFCTATGDQAIFVNRDAFEAIGGVPDIPILEGNRLARRLRSYANGADRSVQRTIHLLDAPVRISARRWRTHGMVRTTCMMYAIRFADRLGVPPATLSKWWSETTPSG
jgi:hypothetical protein